jgi:hypothetical protein
MIVTGTRKIVMLVIKVIAVQWIWYRYDEYGMGKIIIVTVLKNL